MRATLIRFLWEPCDRRIEKGSCFPHYLAFRLQRLGLLAELKLGAISNRVLANMKALSDEGAEEVE
jgi:hypothetical protein